MKMSCLSVSLFPVIQRGELSISDYARHCKALGLDGFDLGILLLKSHTPKYINQLKKDIQEVGLPLCMVTTYPDFTHPDPSQREREFDYLVRDMALASFLGARFLRITAGQAHPGTNKDESIARVADYFRKAASVSDKYSITLVYENHSKPTTWEYMDFSGPPAIFLEIAELIHDTSIGINFDTANIIVAGEDDVVSVLEKVIDQVRTIHVADTGTRGKMDPVPIGTGLVPLKEIFSYLKARNFDGWLCLEEWGNRGLEGVENAVRYARETWDSA